MLADRLLGCPALPDRPLLPDTRPGRRLPGSPAVPGVAPGSGTQSRYPSGVPVTRLSSRSRSHPRDQYPVQAPVRGAGCPAPQRYPSLAVMNFYSLNLTGHKGFLVAISRFFSHPQDTLSYPPRPPVFPPTYPQIRPQTVEFRGPGPAQGPQPASAPRLFRGPGPASAPRPLRGPSPGPFRGPGPASRPGLTPGPASGLRPALELKPGSGREAALS